MHTLHCRSISSSQTKLDYSRRKRCGGRYSLLAIPVVAVTGLFGGSTALAQAIAPQPTSVHLPQDEAPHHNNVEWWYFTGHLHGVDPQGKKREYGFESTIFQFYSVAGQPATYASNIAVTNVTNGTFVSEDSVTVAPIPTQANGFALSVNQQSSMFGGAGAYGLNAAFTDGSYNLQLALFSTMPAVLHNGNGIIPYEGTADSTSAYFSYTALNTFGVIIDHGVKIPVSGIAWQDRQWFNNGGGGISWNWFSVQLHGNVQYMLYYIQNAAGDIVLKVGTEVVNGVAASIPANEMSLSVLSTWTSPTTGMTYPSKWKLTVPDGNYTVTPVFPNQELAGSMPYLEADSTVTGVRLGLPISGVAYAEVKPFW